MTNVTNKPVNNTLRASASTPTVAIAVSIALVHPYACRMSPRLKWAGERETNVSFMLPKLTFGTTTDVTVDD
ncbi:MULTISPECIES: hypothetical protein [unclassified Haladaptatus]|uniref:hypothetical protein n=1 Tax=unclassified Haladaptatus TaxID=2622732 RepID=UPI00209C574F|nr:MULTISPECIES: hypothetical protein [unclassified Haladaptatus]MCO8246251.1 hypothetical protein [Haladaptatus sp. AB643]MCO8255153.1 hypothetical protein [Haladaptatus sp. AB618]